MFFCRKDDCANLKESVFSLEPIRQARVQLHLPKFPPSSLAAVMACLVRAFVHDNSLVSAAKPNTAFRCPHTPVSGSASTEAGFGMRRR